MKQCANGHIFDEKKQDFCPYCRNGAQTFKRFNFAADGNAEAFFSEINFVGEASQGSRSDSDNKREMSKIGALGVDCSSNTKDGVSVRENVPEQLVIDPVCAWIVITEGNYKGISFPIHSEKNYIGRGKNFDVDMYFDGTASTSGDAIINFDPIGKKFCIMPVSDRNNVYINGESLLNNVRISDFDKIRIGVTTFVFRSLCGEQFMY